MVGSYAELSKLVKVCGESGVSELCIDGFEVKFFSKDPSQETAEHQATSYLASETPTPSQNASFVSGASSSPDPRDNILLTPEDRARMEELEYEQVMLDNPVVFEEMNIDRLMGNGTYD